MDEIIEQFSEILLNGDETKEEQKPIGIQKCAAVRSTESDVDAILKERQKKKRTGAKVFCVSCGAVNRTLRKWHNSYLCVDCFKIAQNVGDEKFIKALKGEE